MMSRSVFISVGLVVLLSLAAAAQEQSADEADAIRFFEENVRPLLANNCHNCHSATTNSRSGLRVDDRNGLLTGGDRGPAIVPGDPERSLLIQAVRQTHDKVKMPPQKKLSDDEIAVLVQWIAAGAAWPKVEVPESLGEPAFWYDDLRKSHWAWQPIAKPSMPEVRDGTWPRGAIDHFVLAELESRELKPVGDASPRSFIRRVTYDLTGLPPTPDEVAAFEARVSELNTGETPGLPHSAVEELVDRLLASPAFGERWGRHWLDVARYGESTGSGRNMPYPHAWRYRDYVIDAFNADKPYDEFIREQIAGDLLPAEHQAERDEHLIATGFLALGVRDVNQRFKVRFVMDNIDEQIDTVSRAVMGLTVSCARCHDHKFEPIPTTDYYALAGIFYSTDLCTALRNKMGGGGLDYYDTDMLLFLGSRETTDAAMTEKVAAVQAELELAQTELAALESSEEPSDAETDGQTSDEDRKKLLKEARQAVKKLQNELVNQSDPAMHGPVALGVRAAAVVRDTEIRIRGEAEQLGPVVPRGFLTLFDVPGAPTIDSAHSGRLEFAQWLTSEHNPLTPRVMANRIWQHLFGRGIVPTVDNFGSTGDDPSHPALLDHLASRFVEQGWSVKQHVRAIVLSRTYQLSADTTDANLASDPDNRFLWRHSPRRLEAEEIRDAMLATAGQLDRRRPQGAAVMDFKVREMQNNGAEAKQIAKAADNSLVRSVYLPLLRGLVPHSLEVFDFAEQGMVTGSRDTTTVATQALYLLNDAIVKQQASALAQRLPAQHEADDAGRIVAAYQLAFSRAASDDEIARAVEYLSQYETTLRESENPPENPRQIAWESLCQAILASAEFRYLE